MTELGVSDQARIDRIVLVLGSGGPVTPAPITRVRAQTALARSRDHRITRPRLAWTLAGVVTVAVAAVVIGVLGAGGTQELAAWRVADVWKLPATSHSVQPDPSDPNRLAVSFHGTPYPNYHDDEGWHAVGTRFDRFADHAAFTVFYATGARHSAYTVVADTRVRVPNTARWIVVHGLRLAEFRAGDEWIVFFANHGNSCVLTAAAPRERAWLIKLAAWGPTLRA
jgi:hypothetical protein